MNGETAVAASAGPTAAEQALYLAAVAAGGHLSAAALTPADGPALAGLLDQGLLVPAAADYRACAGYPAAGYTAVDPRSVSDRLGAELRTEATRLLVRAERLPAALDDLIRAYDAVPRPAVPLEAVHIEGTAGIRQRISELLSDCTEELLAAQPGPRPAAALRMAMPQDVALLKRGCAMRTLYQPLAVADRVVVEHVRSMAGHGAEVRVLDEPYQRMLVFDRSVAVVPAADDETRAAFVHNPATVAFLVALFERDWSRAAPVDHPVTATTAHPTTTRVGHLLRQGLTQRTIATRLHLSERSVAAHIARLRRRHGAETLFQLGWRMREARTGESDA
ncbi:LuxR family transcriptional regulator [Kitasatospora sp. NPDC056181]|uniref:LuxR family transcriptional regulator n=1 Tax=Kitasatospora sp. NPDC056181 TaxID=3345737 RepID=UPI0035D59DB9